MGLAEHASKGGFGYLLSTSLLDLTSDKLHDLSSKLASASQQLAQLKTATPRDLWKQELTTLRAALETR
jgi:hypothetical protein